MGKKINDINLTLQSSKNELENKINSLNKQETTLNMIRLQRMNELFKYLFPIERVSATEG